MKNFNFLPFKGFVSFRKVTSIFVAIVMSVSLVVPPSFAQMIPNIAGPQIAHSSGMVFSGPILRGMTVHPENPLQFDFIVDRGQERVQDEKLKTESEVLIKYFLTSLTIPDADAWVNLSPYESNRIIPEALGQTDMGRVMLKQDYQLKQLAASLTNPNTELGKKYWDHASSVASKVWIMPDSATVVEKDGFAYITESKLKVMMDREYRGEKVESSAQDNIFRQLVLPELEKEVNTGKNFAATRQVYQSVILATWYKKALKDSLLGKVYANKSKVVGVETEEKDFKQKVYEQYLQAFKQGAYNLIKEETNEEGETIPRKYFSGGNVMNASSAVRFVTSLQEVQAASAAIQKAGDQFALVSSSAMEPGEGKASSSARIDEKEARAVVGLNGDLNQVWLGPSQQIRLDDPTLGRWRVFIAQSQSSLSGNAIPVHIINAIHSQGDEAYTHIAIDAEENNPGDYYAGVINLVTRAGKKVIYLRHSNAEQSPNAKSAADELSKVLKFPQTGKVFVILGPQSGADYAMQMAQHLNLSASSGTTTQPPLGLFDTPDVNALLTQVSAKWQEIRERGAVMFDLERTITNSITEISPITIQMIASLLEEHIRVVIVTGVPAETLNHIIAEPLRALLQGQNKASLIQGLTFYSNGGATKENLNDQGELVEDFKYAEHHEVSQVILDHLQDVLTTFGRQKFNLGENAPAVAQEWEHWINKKFPKIAVQQPWLTNPNWQIDVLTTEDFVRMAKEGGTFNNPSLFVTRNAQGHISIIRIMHLTKDGQDVRPEIEKAMSDKFQELGITGIRSYSEGVSATDFINEQSTKAFAVLDYVQSNSNLDLGNILYFGDQFYKVQKGDKVVEGNDEIVASQPMLKGITTLGVGTEDPQNSQVSLHIGRGIESTFQFVSKLMTGQEDGNSQRRGQELLAMSQTLSASSALTQAEQVIRGKIPKILIVEDNKDMREAYQKSLRNFGYEVITVTDRQAAEGVISQQDIGFIITDLNVQGVGDEDEIYWLRKYDLPILLITGIYRDSIRNFIEKDFGPLPNNMLYLQKNSYNFDELGQKVADWYNLKTGFSHPGGVASVAVTANEQASTPVGGPARQSVGGIDFNPNNVNLQIKRDGQGVPLPLPQQDLEHIDLKGLTPFIINIQPITPKTLPILSAIAPTTATLLSKG